MKSDSTRARARTRGEISDLSDPEPRNRGPQSIPPTAPRHRSAQSPTSPLARCASRAAAASSAALREPIRLSLAAEERVITVENPVFMY